MKKIFYSALLLILMFPFLSIDGAISRPGYRYWNDWKGSFSNMNSVLTDSTVSSSVVYPMYLTPTRTQVKPLIPANQRVWSYSPVQRRQTTSFYTNNATKLNYTPTTQYSQQQSLFYQRYIQNQSRLLLISRALKQKTQTSVNSDIIPVFDLSLSYKANTSNNAFSEAIVLDTLSFDIISGNGIISDPTDFELVINDDDRGYQFKQDGTVSVQFQNARIARGGDLLLKVGVRVRNPDLISHIPGSFRVRLKNPTAYTELKGGSVSISLQGQTLSDLISYAPIVESTSLSSISTSAQKIYGKSLSAGSKEFVMSLNFEAYSDDMLIHELIVRDTLSQGAIDSFSNGISVLSADTGSILGNAYFVNGAAKIVFKQPLKIGRGGKRYIVLFQIQIKDRINTKNNQFKLSIDPRDIKVYGIGSGKELSESAKRITVQSDIFQVVQSGGKMIVSSSPTQPSGLILGNNLTHAFRFQVLNQEYMILSLARLSLNIRLNGLQFPNGKSIDDFELKQLYQGREVDSILFTPILRDGDIVSFDADRELFVDRNSTVEFVLKLKLQNEGNESNHDSVMVQVIDDAVYHKGTLSAVRDTGAYFIWSDHSGKPHTSGSEDWISGYLINGLPTNFVNVVR